MPLLPKRRTENTGERMDNAVRARVAARGPHGKLVKILAQSRLSRITRGKRRSAGREEIIPRKKSRLPRLSLRFWSYFYKMRGRNPATYDFSVTDTLWSFGGAFLGMLTLALINIQVWGRDEQGLLIGSLGASAMLVFGTPHAPFAQPRNVIGGHIVSALAGVLIQKYVGPDPWIAASLAVALAVALMHVTATLHPPGGATALIAVIGSQELKSFGFEYAFFPVGVSVIVLVAVGVLYNNLSRRRRYPLYWW